MKDKVMWIFGLFGVGSCIMIIMMILGIFLPSQPAQWREWDDPKDGWTFVGRTENGTQIHKKYFKEHGVWIFATYPHGGSPSISAVPLEILRRTEAGDSYK